MRLLVTFCIAAVLSTPVFCQTDLERTMPADFKTDGCTLFPDGNYRDCCEAHDKDYYFGGTSRERRASDKRLYTCVKARSNKFTARIVWLGVRLGGLSFLPTPFRWGFGNKYPRSKPKASEKPTGR